MTQPAESVPHELHNLKKAFVGNSALAAISRIASLLSAIIVTPVVIAKMGLTSYGVWEILLALTSWFVVLDVGLGSALVSFVSRSYARKDMDAVNRYVQSGITISLSLGALIVPIVVIFRTDILTLFRVPGEMVELTSVVLPVTIASYFLRGAAGALSSVIAARQRPGLYSLIVAIGTVAGSICTVVSIVGGMGLAGLAIGQVVSVVIVLGATAVTAKRLCPGLRIRACVPRREDLKRLYGYGIYLFVGQIATLLGQSTDKLVLGAMASPEWVAVYAIASRLASLVREFGTFVYEATVPATAALNGIGDWGRIKRVYSGTMVGTACVTGVIAALVGGLHPYLEVIWLGSFLPKSAPIVLGLVGAGTVHMLTGPGTALCRGVGRPRIEAAYTTILFALNLSLTVGLVALVGPFGTVIATVVSLLAGSAFFFWLFHRAFDLPVASTLRGARTVLAVALAVSGGLVVTHFVGVPASRTAALVAMLPAAAGVVCCYIVGLSVLQVVSAKMILRELGSLLRRRSGGMSKRIL